jgi:hypothetical protein
MMMMMMMMMMSVQQEKHSKSLKVDKRGAAHFFPQKYH